MKLLFSIFILFITTSCATYFKRKDCEKVDWRQYGHTVAMKGQRLSEDSYLNECKKVAAEIDEAQLDSGFKSGMSKYCTPQAAYDTGHSGEFFNPNMCEYNKVKALQAQHTKGVFKFCQPNNGFVFGTSGKKYNNICPADLEKDFLMRYNVGRKKYLISEINTSKEEIQNIDLKISRQLQERRELHFRMSSLPNHKTYVKERVYDPISKTYKEETKVSEDPLIQSQRRNIQHRIQNADHKISELQKQQDLLREKIKQLRAELRGFESNDSI